MDDDQNHVWETGYLSSTRHVCAFSQAHLGYNTASDRLLGGDNDSQKLLWRSNDACSSVFCLSNTVTASDTIYIGGQGQRVAENEIGRTHVYAKYNIRETR